MKKILLLVCALPCLLSAQNAPVKNVLKDKRSIQQVMKSLAVGTQDKAVSLRSGTGNNLPDSIYTYSDKEKKNLTKKTYIKYNVDGRKTEERMIVWWGDSQEEAKTEYTYTSEGGKVKQEIILYWKNEGVWEIAGSKDMYVFSASDLVNPIEQYWYGYDDKNWKLYSKFIAVEFDAAKRPTVYDGEGLSGSEDGTEEWITARITVTYNTQGLKSLKSYFWFSTVLVFKEEFFYNNLGQLIKHVAYEYEFDGSLYATETNEYTYDNRGNESAMLSRYQWAEGDYEESAEYYTNFYPNGTGSEIISTVQSSIYPNPVSDVLNVSLSEAGEAFLTLVNLTGSIVYQQQTSHAVTTIPVGSFAKGYYILSVQSGGRTAVHKVIIR